MTSSPVNSLTASPLNSTGSGSVLAYIHGLSGQSKKCSIVESEHSYSKSWNRHPDPSIKSRPAKFLFMESFLKSSVASNEDKIDVDTLAYDEHSQNPLVHEVNTLIKGLSTSDDYGLHETIPNKSTWTPLAQRLWAKTLSILYSDRLIRLTIEGSPNEVVIRKMLAAKCANRFRHLFSSIAFWDPSLLSWLNTAMCEHISGHYLAAYHEAMQTLRQKLPSLLDRFYTPGSDSRTRNKGPIPDPLQNVLNNHKPKRIKNCPLFILVPNGPQAPNSLLPQRLKHWQLLFASLGKIVTLWINYQPTLKVKDCLNQIIATVREKINECRTNFTEGRPIVLVGFGHSSLIAAHSALDNSSRVTATICLGFPLTGVNGFRGDLDDPLLETTVATLFIIGQNSTMSSIDDMEDFRERMTKAETGLVIVGGANDNLVVSQTKQRFEGITQSIVDRCIADEIYDFINYVLNPHYVPSENNNSPAPVRHLSVYRNLSSASSPSISKLSLVKPKNRPRKRPPKKTELSTKPESSRRESKSELSVTAPPTIPESVEPPLPPPPPPPVTKESKKRKEPASSPASSGAEGANSTPNPKRKKEENSSTSSHDKIDKIEKTLEAVISSAVGSPDILSDSVNGAVRSPSTPGSKDVASSGEKAEKTEKSEKVEKSDKLEKTEKEKSTTSTPNHPGRHYDFSYDVSQVSTFSSAATRTRQIRAPKQLDM